jgi:hypothetical protein
MTSVWILLLGFGVFGVLLMIWLGLRWLAQSWELIDDDELHQRLSRAADPKRTPGLWLRMRGWFGGGPPRLAYRRDKLGRFRKIWRE